LYREPAPPSRPCPRCRVGLVGRPLGDVQIDECTACNGVFVGAHVLSRLLDDLDLGPEVRAAFSLGSVAAPTQGPVYVACPVCGKLMNRRLYALGSEVIVDECRLHGTWFEDTELRRLVEFARAGGLEREKARREKERERERARAHAPPSLPEAEVSLWSAILGFLRDRLR